MLIRITGVNEAIGYDKTKQAVKRPIQNHPDCSGVPTRCVGPSVCVVSIHHTCSFNVASMWQNLLLSSLWDIFRGPRNIISLKNVVLSFIYLVIMCFLMETQLHSG